MAESYLQGFNPPAEETPKPRKLVGRSSAAAIEMRRQRLYRRQLDGLSARHLVLEHAAKKALANQQHGLIGAKLMNGMKRIGKKIVKICSPVFKQ